jgi:hypothetical protein
VFIPQYHVGKISIVANQRRPLLFLVRTMVAPTAAILDHVCRLVRHGDVLVQDTRRDAGRWPRAGLLETQMHFLPNI